ncbi:hypothetical protein HanRHA438_Chr04g0186441 [Helianthus annuus]|nr:hypothetical protein HanIR_Chr04g0190501 [Helianthus annuus]KAJ0927750.1 hypothetical protein HanRHA438_Chr04g0186441 [Helianthus annuus]
MQILWTVQRNSRLVRCMPFRFNRLVLCQVMVQLAKAVFFSLNDLFKVYKQAWGSQSIPQCKWQSGASGGVGTALSSTKRLP